MSELLKKTISREEFNHSLENEAEYEKGLGGIPIQAEVTTESALITYIPVKEFEFYIDVWNCYPRLGQRIHTGRGSLRTEIIELKKQRSETLLGKLCELRDVMITMSGHYYMETDEQAALMNRILKIEGLRS